VKNLEMKTENVDYFSDGVTRGGTLSTLRRLADKTNGTNDDVFRSVCSA
jgi:hypothetical protein